MKRPECNIVYIGTLCKQDQQNIGLQKIHTAYRTTSFRATALFTYCVQN